ncbi:multicopper oxidase domain-containing protein [Iamia sp. SCSIO 61187]|uniref:multicopper oxidase family protein n=1 Tax=Iamia sp. SCSIO 61187 TaxID=2722752 RepID=UPI001C62ADF7|nr:multicopper oxidase domain-containing protein [Iamia sp. SCSIO 61187]QYG93725.1 multicopper oxidase domain-containing protein [Iamia sp. SCSIO 61187]
MVPVPAPAPRRDRRVWLRVLLALGLAGALVVTAVAVVVYRVWDSREVSTVGELSFANDLAIPPLDEGTIEDGRRVFSLTAAASTSSFKPGLSTPTLGYDGPYLGPTLRMHRGEDVEVRVTNELDETTTTHWHGMSLPAVADGGPHSPIAPGDTWRPRWTVDQPAATLWYHPHPHEQTEDQVHRGLAGMVIVDEEGSASDELPHEYGVDDIPVIVQDRSFAGDGTFEEGSGFLTQTGRLGDELLVNGTWDPHLDVTTERVRLRVLNASTARVYDFGFSDDRPFQLVATDGGLLEAPVDLDRIRLSPGERAEVVVAVEPGERTVLRSFPPALGLGPLERFEGGDDSFDVLQLRAAGELAPSPTVPEELGDPPSFGPEDAVAERSFHLNGVSEIDGREMDPERIDTVVRAGSVERWDVRADGTGHSFHLHDVQFRVLSVDGDDPPPELSGWKDTVFLPSSSRVSLLIRFSHHADAETPYMYHCHLLRHEDNGMMGQVLVTEDGEGPDRIDGPHDHGG